MSEYCAIVLPMIVCGATGSEVSAMIACGFGLEIAFGCAVVAWWRRRRG